MRHLIDPMDLSVEEQNRDRWKRGERPTKDQCGGDGSPMEGQWEPNEKPMEGRQIEAGQCELVREVSDIMI